MADEGGGFNNRVDKVFGCITTSSSKQWSLTDAQIERRAWKPHPHHSKRDDDETPSSSCFNNTNMFKRPSNNNNINKGNDGSDPDDDNNDEKEEEWDIQRSSIGLDPTLDFEEEEDAYDKMAEGREENVGDDDDDGRLYMKDVTHHGPFLNSNNVLPTSTHHVPSANQDDDDDDDDTLDEPMLNAQDEQPCAPPPPTTEDGVRIKSILKRKSDDLLAKPAKRVRFDETCKNNDYLQNFDVPEVPENGPGVPDYVINPSKYTRYTFDDDDDDDVSNKSNTQAYMDLLDQIKKSKQVGLEQQKPPPGDLTSVVFIPRKKRGDAATCNSEGKFKQSSTSIGIAAIEVQQGEVSEMQEDDLNVDALSEKPRFQKPGRRYRSKMEEDDNGC